MMTNPQEPQPAQSQVQPMDATQLEAAFTRALQRQQPVVAQPQQMTQEQQDQILGTYRADLNTIRALFGENATEQQVEMFNQIIQGVVQNAATISNLLGQHYARSLYSQIEPHLNDARELGQERFFTTLYEGHEGLRQFDPLLKHMLKSFQEQEGYPATGRAAQAKFVREKAIELIKQQQPDFDPTGKAGQQQQPQQRGGPQFTRTQHQQSSGTQQQTQQQKPVIPTLPSLGSGGGGQGPSVNRQQSNGGGASSSGHYVGADMFTAHDRS